MLSLEAEAIITKMKQELDDWLNDRYAEYITTDELDAEWTELASQVLTSALTEYDEAIPLRQDDRIDEGVHECLVCGVVLPFVAWAEDEPCPVCHPFDDPIDTEYGYPTKRGR